MAQQVKNPPIMQETQEILVQSLGQKGLMKKQMATHSSILAWKIPWTEEPGCLQFKGSKRVKQDWVSKHKGESYHILVHLKLSDFLWINSKSILMFSLTLPTFPSPAPPPSVISSNVSNSLLPQGLCTCHALCLECPTPWSQQGRLISSVRSLLTGSQRPVLNLHSSFSICLPWFYFFYSTYSSLKWYYFLNVLGEFTSRHVGS